MRPDCGRLGSWKNSRGVSFGDCRTDATGAGRCLCSPPGRSTAVLFSRRIQRFFFATHTHGGGRKERRRSFGVSRNTIQRAVTSMFWAEAGWWTDRETCARRAQAVREAARPVDGATMKQNRREQAFRARGGGRGDTHHGTSVDGVRQDTRAGQTESWLST